MVFMLNGGRDERGVMNGTEAHTLYESLGIERMLLIPLAIMETHWQIFWRTNPNFIQSKQFATKSITTFDSAEDIQQKLTWADAIYFPGGSPNTLLTRIDERHILPLIDLRKSSGHLKLIAGGSAGAMVMGEYCIIGHTNVKNILPGLSLLPNYMIDSHFSNRNREPRLLEQLASRKHAIGLGIDEDTAVLLNTNMDIQHVFGAGDAYQYKEGKCIKYDQGYTAYQD